MLILLIFVISTVSPPTIIDIDIIKKYLPVKYGRILYTSRFLLFKYVTSFTNVSTMSVKLFFLSYVELSNQGSSLTTYY